MAPPGKPPFGKLFGRFGVSAIPHVLLIDESAQLVMHGTLGEVLEKARELGVNKKKQQLPL